MAHFVEIGDRHADIDSVEDDSPLRHIKGRVMKKVIENDLGIAKVSRHAVSPRIRYGSLHHWIPSLCFHKRSLGSVICLNRMACKVAHRIMPIDPSWLRSRSRATSSRTRTPKKVKQKKKLRVSWNKHWCAPSSISASLNKDKLISSRIRRIRLTLFLEMIAADEC